MRRKLLLDARDVPGLPASSRRRIGRKPECHEEPFMVEIPREVAYLVSFVLIEAAFIDGRSFRVPNWLTFHFVLGGWIYAYWSGGGALLLLVDGGAAVGLMTLLPLYAIGGMGAGDVKLMAGVGAWIGPAFTLGLPVLRDGRGADGVGDDGLLRRAVPASRDDAHHRQGGPRRCATPRCSPSMAARRKPTMMLLPYGIPIAVGTIGYLAWAGFLSRPRVATPGDRWPRSQYEGIIHERQVADHVGPARRLRAGRDAAHPAVAVQGVREAAGGRPRKSWSPPATSRRRSR